MPWRTTKPERDIPLRKTKADAIFANAITDDREDAIGVDLLLREEQGHTLLVRSAGISVDEAIERAADEVERILGGSWGCDDFFAAS